jgi:zinc/manganese transport system substrate-binding protein
VTSVRVVRPGALVATLVAVTTAAGCTVAPPAATETSAGGAPAVNVVASLSAWGSILAQLGGNRVHATSVVRNPNTDPHDYEPTPADGRAIASARLIVVNGVGYDSWAARAAAANDDPHQTLLDVGRLVGVPAGGNPHRWYAPPDVEKVADAITADLKSIDPPGASYFESQRRLFETTGLARYHALIGAIRASYAGTPVGASESMFALLSQSLGLNLVTPASFLRAVSEGSEPSAADKAAADHQVRDRKIKVYVFNSQNSTPDVAAQVKAARAAGIPVVSITETLSPATASFEDWQVAQLEALKAALQQAARR